ncbi:O-antigen ligase domain-containing protein [Flavobacterium sp. GA093]|uniref:O-antigen ligase domain-containing protein n=1 Tax=Flavobacterium hydrocarbonoxydans TaxID=2683249 RepID=A0A6I4NK51_9FLAO|nr:O-antigen ligase family protein [Flavobacterium hydrocarbonoxydans]MWB94531.1 O-antigen ligase domain-containing protein [Flavobacterium hydrocarbonoxydans]
MDKKTVSYIFVIAIHLGIALAVFVLPFLSKLYAFLIPIVGGFLVYRTKNRNNEVILVSAYLVGAEVFLRMTGGNLNNEYIKLCVIVFMLIGMTYSGFSAKAIVFFLFLLLLIPSVLITTATDDYSTNVKKVLVFNLSGPLCLAICAIYTFQRKITFLELQYILMAIGFPILTTTIYLFLYNPSVRDVVTGTQSNFETSGGFGPNQVSTILGLGMFVFFTQFILYSKTKILMIINGLIVLFVSYRAIVTFSRGGVITGVGMIILLLIVLYFYSSVKIRGKFFVVFLLTGLMGLAIWTYTSMQTSGLIEKRYANQDAAGRTKKDRLGGREAIMDIELKTFFENPVLGIGAGMGKQVRKDNFGVNVASHNEMTRMLSEHGLFGIFDLLILLITPLLLFFNNRQHLYLFSFYVFWLLTINHAAMRIAAPAFVYALALLSIESKSSETKKKVNVALD